MRISMTGGAGALPVGSPIDKNSYEGLLRVEYPCNGDNEGLEELRRSQGTNALLDCMVKGAGT